MGFPFPALLGAFVLGCAPQLVVPSEYPDLAPGRYARTLETGGFYRTYTLRVPPAYDRAEPTPLLFMLHGYTGNAAFSELKLGAEADKEGWVSVYPNGIGNPQGWNAGFLNLTGKTVDDVAFFGKLLDRIEGDVHVDPSRIYVAGYSNGAMMAHLLGARFSDRIAAVGSVSGIVGLTKTSMIPNPKGPISVIMLHGTADPMVAYDARSNALLKGVPVEEGARWWAKAVGASSSPSTQTDRKVKIESWGHGRGGSEVRLVTVQGMTHDWPTAALLNGIDPARMLIDFFRTHPKGSIPTG